MYNFSNQSSYPFWINNPMQNFHNMNPYYFWYNMQMLMNPYAFGGNNPYFARPFVVLQDYGPEPYVVNIEDATKQNDTFRTALWTGEDLQVTLMSIDVGDDIGLEVHPEGDQFIRIEEGAALIKMGDSKNKLDYQRKAFDDYAIMIPAGKWHNVINIGDKPLKLYAIYAPPEHPRDTVHETKEDALEEENNYRYYKKTK